MPCCISWSTRFFGNALSFRFMYACISLPAHHACYYMGCADCLLVYIDISSCLHTFVLAILFSDIFYISVLLSFKHSPLISNEVKLHELVALAQRAVLSILYSTHIIFPPQSSGILFQCCLILCRIWGLCIYSLIVSRSIVWFVHEWIDNT